MKAKDLRLDNLIYKDLSVDDLVEVRLKMGDLSTYFIEKDMGMESYFPYPVG